ncbi:glycine cleavage system protein GcvH [Rickettsiales bacterium]|nr:glycine cleavage system protein GcvH [Rickettsiales bacterium]
MKYTKEHEWVKLDGDIATVGITQHAADALGELVYVELPESGESFEKGDAAIVVESSKSASDVYAPVAGEISEINDSLESAPENVNNSPYDDGWLVKIKVSDASQIDQYMSEEEYQSYIKED